MENEFQRGAAIGILGGGQLARMLILFGTGQLGLKPVVWCQSPTDPAAQVAESVILGDWDDPTAFEKFACWGFKSVMCEFENVPAEVVEKLGKYDIRVHSLPEVLRTAQHRMNEKMLAGTLKGRTVDWTAFTLPKSNSGSPLADINLGDWPDKTIVKTDRWGYDGHGQARFASHGELLAGTTHEALTELFGAKNTSFVLEVEADLDFECSVMIARNDRGNFYGSPAVRNVHQGGILHHSFWYEGVVPREIEIEAQQMAVKFAEYLDLVGLLCCEFFVTKDGEVLFNEMAPRPHNSFHGSIEAATTSQFMQYVEAVTPGLVLTPMKFEQPWAMVNLLGENINKIPELRWRGWHCHDYGKHEVKPGRKMGHATIIQESDDSLHATIRTIANI